MAVDIDKQKMSLNKVVARNSEVVWFEQDILVPDTKPDVMKIVQVEVIPFVSNAEVLDGSLRITGDVTYYIIYKAMDNDKTRGVSMTYPYSKTINIKEAKKGMNARVTVNTRNVIFSLPNERKISVKTELVFKYVISQKDDIEIMENIKEGIDIEAKKAQDTFYNVVDVKQEIFDVKEDIVIPEGTPKIGEILQVSSNISNTDYKVSYNKILVKGDVNLEILYLENNDSGNIFTYVTQVPFTGMIEFENIKENYRFDIKYNLRNLELIQGENSILTVSFEVLTDAIMFEERQVEYVNDFYSTKNNLNYDKSEVAVIKNKEVIEKQIALKDSIGVTDKDNKIVSYKVNPVYLNTKISGNKLYIDGPLKVNVTFKNTNTNTVDAKTYDLLVNSTIDLGKEIDEKNTDITVSVLSKSISLDNSNILANIILNVVCEIENIDKITIVGTIEEENLPNDSFDSMYMYIVKKGDTLWQIAKKYKTTVDKIANINNIVDENKIDIGQKILIIR